MNNTRFLPALAPALVGLVFLANACSGDQQVVLPDAGTVGYDAGAGPTVKVTYQGASTVIPLDSLTPVTVAGVSSVKLGDVLAAAVQTRTLDQLVATDFVSADGYTPRSKSNCDGLLPVAGSVLSNGYLDPATRTLKWDDSLGYPGCLTVRDLAEILVADK